MRAFVLPALVVVAAAGTAACGTLHIREAKAVQPNPAIHRSVDVLPISEKLYIYQRDMSLPRDYQLRSSAQFAVVNKDRIRFHVTIVRYDEDEADVANWDAYMQDETGKRYPLASREGTKKNRLSITWGLYPYVPGDSWCRQPPCLSKIIPGYDVYQGVADLVFHAPMIMGEGRQSVLLVLRRGTLEYHYRWTFGQGTEITHYGRTKVDEEMGIISVPGPNIPVAGTEEGDEWTSEPPVAQP